MIGARRLIAVLIIGAAIVAAGFIVQKGRTGNLRARLGEEHQPLAVNNESVSLPPPMQEETPTAANEITPAKDTPRSPENLTGNATAALAKKIADGLIKKNPEGPSLDGTSYQIKALDPEATASQFMDEALAEIDIEQFYPGANLSQIKISNTAGGEVTYRDAVGLALKKHYLAAAQNGRSPNPAQLARAAQDTMAAFYEIEVPKTLLATHIKEIELLAAQTAMLEAIDQGNDDPLRALVAVQLLEQTMDDFIKLNETLSKTQG